MKKFLIFTALTFGFLSNSYAKDRYCLSIDSGVWLTNIIVKMYCDNGNTDSFNVWGIFDDEDYRDFWRDVRDELQETDNYDWLGGNESKMWKTNVTDADREADWCILGISYGKYSLQCSNPQVGFSNQEYMFLQKWLEEENFELVSEIKLARFRFRHIYRRD